ncbi:F-box protein [Aspergillus ibericus CBS 121593]|uniref:F-box domain-containing protein n=1 Tax=Aspergillus ibericus CBS 121593 TaxID=1448316 RepID=A0A395GR15_9EURO|nr:hypothetical protein BO80DRAFT_468551 [Aspergillus ibericus CBS 121593]RAK96513.1 hypothetical protein BO80DRAFT_468551 [Aspergillus ibericus CBS 121593]
MVNRDNPIVFVLCVDNMLRECKTEMGTIPPYVNEQTILTAKFHSKTPKPAPPHPAQTKVLTTPDTLLTILHYLPPHDLLSSERVCRLWNTLIKSTHTLQCILGYRFPSPPPEHPTFNPLLQWLFPSLFPITPSTKTTLYFVPETIHSLPFAHNRKYHEKVFSEHASWRRMKPMDVPCRIKKLVIHWKDTESHEPRDAAYRVYDPWAGQDPVLGADMALVWDFVLCGLGAYAERGMVVQWVLREGVDGGEGEGGIGYECSVLVGQKNRLERGRGTFRFSCLRLPVEMESEGWGYLGGKNEVEVREWQVARKEEERSLLWKTGDDEDDEDDTGSDDEFDYLSDSDVEFPGGPSLDTSHSGDEWDWDAAVVCSKNPELSWRV